MAFLLRFQGKGEGVTPTDMKQVVLRLYEKAAYPLQLPDYLLRKDQEVPIKKSSVQLLASGVFDYDSEQYLPKLSHHSIERSQ